MNIVISGASGMIGRTLTEHLRGQGHRVAPLVRLSNSSVENNTAQGIVWDINAGTIEKKKLEGQDVVIHLAGANVSERWTPAYKRLIESSRVQGTRLLSQTLLKLERKPRLLISASAIGYYGNHPSDVILDEASPQGHGFLSQVCGQWEQETKPAAAAGIRVVNMRMGVVLDRNGGALAKMLPIFNLGLGGVLGRGEQMMSWVALNEIPLIVDHIMRSEVLAGPVNVVSPQAVSNREFTHVLGKVIRRPVILPVPAFGIKLLFGEMGQQLLLEGAHVVPGQLQSSGYVFTYSDLPSALRNVVETPRAA